MPSKKSKTKSMLGKYKSESRKTTGESSSSMSRARRHMKKQSNRAMRREWKEQEGYYYS
jgi:hypothetical protein